jgi:excisionase family DNA binding protein
MNKKNNSDLKKITLEDTPLEIQKLGNLVNEVYNAVLVIIKNLNPKEQEEYLTITEVADYLKVDKSTVYKWTIKGKLTKYMIENTVRYKKSDIDSSMMPLVA